MTPTPTPTPALARPRSSFSPKATPSRREQTTTSLSLSLSLSRTLSKKAALTSQAASTPNPERPEERAQHNKKEDQGGFWGDGEEE